MRTASRRTSLQSVGQENVAHDTGEPALSDGSCVALVGGCPAGTSAAATVLADLRRAIVEHTGGRLSVLTVAVHGGGSSGGGQVDTGIRRDVRSDYVAAADLLNFRDVAVVCLACTPEELRDAHAPYVLDLVDNLRRPVVFFFCGADRVADGAGRSVAEAVARRADRIMVSTAQARDALVQVWGVAERKIAVLPPPADAVDAYLGQFALARGDWIARRHPDRPAELPELDLRHLRLLTDDTGICQHCRHATPDWSHGYTTDDNARALIAAAMCWRRTRDQSVLELIHRYLSFLTYAANGANGRCRNFMSFDRSWNEETGSQDSHARTLWALGATVALAPDEVTTLGVMDLFRELLPAAMEFHHPRSQAFTIVGIDAYLRRFPGEVYLRKSLTTLTDALTGLFRARMTDDWPWIDDTVTYANAKLPHALMLAGSRLGRDDCVELGLHVLDWLVRAQTNRDGALSIIGNDGWFHRDGTMAQFDQQPLEAHNLLEACVAAYRITGRDEWLDRAHRVFKWFLGHNDLRLPLYDPLTGGCHDGLQVDRVNRNQGSESLLAWLLSLLLMHELQDPAG